MYTPSFKLSPKDLEAKEAFLTSLDEQGLLDSKHMLRDFKPANNYLLTVARGFSTKTSVLEEEALLAQKEAKEEEIKKKGIIVDSSIRKELENEKMVKDAEDAIDKRHYVLNLGKDYNGEAKVGDSIIANTTPHNVDQFYQVPLWDAELNTETMEWELAEYVFTLVPSHWIIGVFKSKPLVVTMFDMSWDDREIEQIFYDKDYSCDKIDAILRPKKEGIPLTAVEKLPPSAFND